MSAEKKADMAIRTNTAQANSNKEVTEEVTNSTAAASLDTRVDIMSAERKANMEEGIKMSTAVPVVMKAVMAVVTRTIIAVDGDKRDTVEVDKVKMTTALANNNKEVMEEATSSMVAASVDKSAERKVNMEEGTKMSTVVPVDIKAIMEITRTIIAAVASNSKADMAAAGIFPREEAMAVVVATEGAMTISAELLSMLNSTRDIPMTAEYIPAS